MAAKRIALFLLATAGGRARALRGAILARLRYKDTPTDMKDNTLALFWSEKAAQQRTPTRFQHTLGWVQAGSMAPGLCPCRCPHRKGAEQSHNLAQYNPGECIIQELA